MRCPTAGSTTKVTPSLSKSAGLPVAKINTGSPNTTEDRSTGGLALPAVPLASDHEHPAGFRPTGCLVGLLNLKLPPLGIPPRSRGGGCQSCDGTLS